MIRIITAGIAAIALGAVGGLALNRTAPQKASTSELQSATIASATVATTAKPADPAPKRTVAAEPTPNRTAEAAPAPKVTPAPAGLPIPADLLKETPEVSFDGDRVSVRLGRYKIEF